MILWTSTNFGLFRQQVLIFVSSNFRFKAIFSVAKCPHSLNRHAIPIANLEARSMQPILIWLYPSSEVIHQSCLVRRSCLPSRGVCCYQLRARTQEAGAERMGQLSSNFSSGPYNFNISPMSLHGNKWAENRYGAPPPNWKWTYVGIHSFCDHGWEAPATPPPKKNSVLSPSTWMKKCKIRPEKHVPQYCEVIWAIFRLSAPWTSVSAPSILLKIYRYLPAMNIRVCHEGNFFEI